MTDKRQTNLDWQLAAATRRGNREFVNRISELRWNLSRTALARDWHGYNECAAALNENGAAIPLVSTTEPEETQMGMFDAPIYLTGEKGFAQEGDTFWIHNARVADTVTLGGKVKDQVKLQVSNERDGEKVVVYTAGAAIVNQVKRMDAGDRAAMPIEVRLDQVPSKEGSPTNVLTPASQPPASASTPSGGDF